MSHASLASRYRPQLFSEVTGQDMIKTILSRASAQDKIAPAYLLSGTRGVGKTTIARIFAKALNCINSPTAEPCNVCDACKKAMLGNHVDIIEIDGASNNKVDDARKLKENIGYAPMEGRYKVFIIDEAHMLTTQAFNALLKTLEEPPKGVVFIMATTEPHKFPQTIISRCQQFVFQAQPERELIEHLRRVIEKENIKYDEESLHLIARRGAGSVRDSMSLLGQTLAFGGDELNIEVTRNVLGVAGQEAYERLLVAMQKKDCFTIVSVTQELINRGIDISFFLKELSALWRNLFLICQAGESEKQNIVNLLDLPPAEQQRLIELAKLFNLSYIHAAWHMCLDSQKQILDSLEPASSLELLLLNLAMLSELISLDILSENTGELEILSSKKAQMQVTQATSSPHNNEVKPQIFEQTKELSINNELKQTTNAAINSHNEVAAEKKNFDLKDLSFEGLVEYCKNIDNTLRLQQVEGEFIIEGENISLNITTKSHMHYNRLRLVQDKIIDCATNYCNKKIALMLNPPLNEAKTEGELLKEMNEHPIIKRLSEDFGAQLVKCKK